MLVSHVQIRGSVPVFWEQKGLKEPVTITRSPVLTKNAFRLHIKDILETYGPLKVVNLLRYMKVGKELTITSEFVRQYLESEYKDQIKFLNFDFHGYCGGEKYHNLKVMIQYCKTEIEEHGWFVENQSQKLQMQNGVIRTNCLDSLDRTNVAQSKIGMVVLQMQLEQQGFNLQQLYGDSMDKEGIAFCFEGGKDDILFKVRNMWTVMGDYLSRQYAGTDSTISRVSRDGKEGFIGKIDH